MITKHERRLIDEAIAAGRVQVIPRGQSAFDPTVGLHWKDTQTYGHQLRAFQRGERLKKADKIADRQTR